MKRYDFKDISFLIHVRIDVDDRLENLSTVLEYYHHNCNNIEFIIVNDDIHPDNKLKPLHEQYPNSKFLFQQNDGVYHRTRAFNEASKHTDRPVVVAGDTDVIVHPEYLLRASNQLIQDETIGSIYPYNGLFIHVSKDLKKKIQQTNCIEFLPEHIPDPSNRVPYYQTEHILVAHPHSLGGCIMYNHNNWKKFKGYNPGFVGWGREDDEIWHRVKTLGYKIERIMDDRAVAWHLPHDNTVREKHPYYERNGEIVQYVLSLTDKQSLENYIKNWNL